MNTYEITVTTGNPLNPQDKIYVDADTYIKDSKRKEYQFKIDRKVVLRLEIDKVMVIQVKRST